MKELLIIHSNHSVFIYYFFFTVTYSLQNHTFQKHTVNLCNSVVLHDQSTKRVCLNLSGRNLNG